MRTRAIVTSTFASLGVLVVGWQVGAAGITTLTTSSQGVTSSTGTGTSTATGTGAGTTTSTTSESTGTPTVAASGVTDGTFAGDAVSTRFGNVQVQVTVSGGQITDVTALQLTDHDRKSVQISNRAAPILAAEIVSAQSASVSNVSGATYTTRAYEQSAQSALDQAGL